MSAVAVFHADHAEHLREALRAHDAGLPVFLGNPHWADAERAEAERQLPRGTLILGTTLEARGLGTCDWPLNWRGRVMIPTGGTGRLRLAIHPPLGTKIIRPVDPRTRRRARRSYLFQKHVARRRKQDVLMATAIDHGVDRRQIATG